MRKNLGRVAVLSAAVAVVVTGRQSAEAASFTWNNTTGNWSVPTNWTGGIAPTGAGATDILTFGGSGAATYTATNNIADPFLLNEVILNSTSSATPIIAGTKLQLTGAGAAFTQNSTGAFTFSAPVNFSSATTFGGTGAGQLSFTGALSGSAPITKTSSGTLEIFNASGTTTNTFFGGFTVNGGTLYVRPVNSPRAATYTLRANPITLGASGTLLYNGTGGSTTLAELRIGEINGSGTVNMTNGNGLALTMLADASSSATVSAGAGGSGSAVAVYVRGIGTQTFSGNTTGIIEPINVYRGAGLTLSGSGTTGGVLGNTADVDLNVFGGTITLDNTAANSSSAYGRVANNSVVIMGGGKLSFVGNSAGSSETVSGVALNGGSHTISVTNNGGTGAALAFTDSNSLRDSTSMTVNFVGAGTGSLGSAGNNPRVTFSGALFTNTTNGMLANTNSATAATIGWATVNGTNWAGVGANGIVALADTNRTGATLASATAWEMTNLTNSATLGANLTVGALKITPSSGGQSLALGTNNVASTAVMLAGTTDFSVTGTGNLLAGGASRYIYVTDAATTLTASAVIADGANPTSKSGPGFLVLNGVASQNTLTTTNRLNLLDGTLRANSTQLGFGSSGGAGIIAFRGGVLEINGGGDGTGTSADFRRPVNSSAGGVNWNGAATDLGNGGFSAFGSNASINLGGNSSPSTVTWGSGGFIQDDYTLIFGSTKANARIRLLNPLALDGGSVNAYQARNINVIDNPNSSSDVARLEGAVSSFITTDLLKTGDGALELAGTNTGLTGGVIVAEGTLLLANNSALGSSAYVMVGARGGSADVSLLTEGAFSTARDLTVVAGNSGVITIGGNTDNNSTYSGKLELYKDVSLTSVTTGANATTFSGALSGVGNVTKSGAGTVVLSNANNAYAGTTSVNVGTLQIAGTLAAGGGAVTVGAATLNGSGTINRNVVLSGSSTLGGSTLTIGNSSTLTANGAGNVVPASNTVSVSGLTTVNGELAVNGTLSGAGAVTVAGSLNGSGTISKNVTNNGTLSGTLDIAGTISGSGLTSPGNSPGILTATNLDPSGGQDFAFEFTSVGSPDYTNETASVNDLLRLTDATTPFASALGGGNVVSVYLNVNSVSNGDVFRGAFYTDKSSDFFASINAASFAYYIKDDGVGGFATTYNGVNYDLFSVQQPGLSIGVSTVNESGTQFASVDGYVTQFTLSAIPEPSGFGLIGVALLGTIARRRRQHAA